MKTEIIFENEDLIALEKPAGIEVYEFVKMFLEELPLLKNVGRAPRYGLVHRLDKETSGILLVAKNNKALEFYQRQFLAPTKRYLGPAKSANEKKHGEREVLREYLALVVGIVKENKEEIETLIGRSQKDRKKQAAFLPLSPQSQKEGLRGAKTIFEIKERFENYTFLKVVPETGRRHQIRVHLAFINHPVVGDKIYGFKNQLCPKELKRLFLHAAFLKIKGPTGKYIEIKSELPSELKKIIKKLK